MTQSQFLVNRLIRRRAAPMLATELTTIELEQAAPPAEKPEIKAALPAGRDEPRGKR